MDWWRAKLVLIAAFLCLDLLLAWQVRRMHVPAAPGLALHGLPGSAAPPPLPVLEVEWLDTWKLGDAQRLVPASTCTPYADPKTQRLLFEACAAPGGSAEVDWYAQGLLVYTSSRGVPAGSRNSAATAAVKRVVLPLDPDVWPAVWNPLHRDGATGVRDYAAVETYAGVPLFNGQWHVAVGPHGIQAQRRWLLVVAPATAPASLIAPRQASTEAGRIYTPAAVSSGEPPVLGYFSPKPAAPGNVWDVFPAYRIRLRNGDCIYVDAVAEPAGAGGANASFEQPCELSFGQGSE